MAGGGGGGGGGRGQGLVLWLVVSVALLCMIYMSCGIFKKKRNMQHNHFGSIIGI